MKYFGEKSLSSVTSSILHVCWYLVLVMAIGVGIFMSAVIFSGKFQNLITTEMTKKSEMMTSEELKDIEDWKKFQEVPVALKVLAFPYVGAIVVLLLMIIKKSRALFTNFRKDVVFNKNNVEIMSGLNKLLVIFSILTFNLSSLLLCALLAMLCEVFRNGATLQEEHDATV